MTTQILLRVAEVAEAIGCSRSKAYELIASGEIPSVRIGGLIRVPVDQLRQRIDQLVVERDAITNSETPPIVNVKKFG